MTRIRFRIHCGLCASFLMAGAALAQMPAYTQAGPVPPAIPAAKTVFVANAGADSGLFPEPFSGDEDRGYTEFYAALKAAGAYTLTGDPSQADLVLELRLNAPYGPSNPNKPNGAADPLPQFRLIIYDRRTHYVLWTITQSIDAAYMQKNHDKNFDQALAEVLRQFLQVAGKTPAGQGQIPTSN
jgi:hypothetical protein